MGSEEIAKLRMLLTYWIEHNTEHSQEFREWAGKARGFGETKAAEEMLRAVEAMDKANEPLVRALRGLGEKEL